MSQESPDKSFEKRVKLYEVEVERIQTKLQDLMQKKLIDAEYRTLDKLIKQERRRGRLGAINLGGEGYEAYTAKQQELESKKNSSKFREESINKSDIKARELSREVTGELYDLALDIDGNIDELLGDSRFLRRYTYDGVTFKPKDKDGVLFFALDGLHVLTSLQNSYLDSFFSQKRDGDNKGIKPSFFSWFDFDKHLWVAKTRLINWRQRGDIALLSKEEVKKRIEKLKTDMTDEERRFFQPYEEEMGLTEAELADWLKNKFGI